MRKPVFARIMRLFSRAAPPVFLYQSADSYYLPEGRYYAAPLVYKRCAPRRGKALPLFLGFGFTLLFMPAVRQKPPPPLPNNMTVLAAGAQRAIDADDSGQTAPKAAAAGQYAAAGREDRLNRSGKGASPLARQRNSLPRLVNYDKHYAALAEYSVIETFTAALKSNGEPAYAVRFQPPRRAKAGALLALGFAPPPQKKAPPALPVPKMLAALVNNNEPDILALGYAAVPADSEPESPFDAILADNKRKADKKSSGRFVPPIGRRDHPWAATPLPASAFTPKQQKCLAEAIYFEARSESLRGQAAIAQVVLNRVRNPAYPDAICDVVYQNVNWYNRCQFSFACDGKKHKVTERQPWQTAIAVAKSVTAGQIWLADIGSSTHYHAVYVRPHWAALMDKMQKIGSHIFYRTKNGGWS